MSEHEIGNLKHLRLAYDYMLNVPERLVSLNNIGHQLEGEGFDQPCGAVGCLGGWLQTMPEVREHGRTMRYGKKWTGCMGFEAISGWLGLSHTDANRGRLFAGRVRRDVSEKQEALDRLAVLIREAEEHERRHHD